MSSFRLPLVASILGHAGVVILLILFAAQAPPVPLPEPIRKSGIEVVGIVDDREDDVAAALERRCDGCIEALEIFVDAYGAEAGNLALRVLSTGGLFVGGGIAPKILPALADGRFLRAFRAKRPFESLLAAMPIKVVLNTEVALLGAAVFAARSLSPRAG